MPDLRDGKSFEMKGSGAKPYVLKNTGGVYSCTCPAWRNQSTAIERRTCKHLRRLRGETAEEARLGSALPQRPLQTEAEESRAPALLLAETWDTATDLAGWLMSEKLDGVRAYWDGRQFLSRQGNLFHAPDWFVEGFPDVPLDGELWIDRKGSNGRSASCGGRTRATSGPRCGSWSSTPPRPPAGSRSAWSTWRRCWPAGPPKFARRHEHLQCEDVECLRAELARVEALGGEGLMLREPGSRYKSGRSMTLLEGEELPRCGGAVMGIRPARASDQGRLGALLARLPGRRQVRYRDRVQRPGARQPAARSAPR